MLVQQGGGEDSQGTAEVVGGVVVVVLVVGSALVLCVCWYAVRRSRVLKRGGWLARARLTAIGVSLFAGFCCLAFAFHLQGKTLASSPQHGDRWGDVSLFSNAPGSAVDLEIRLASTGYSYQDEIRVSVTFDRANSTPLDFMLILAGSAAAACDQGSISNGAIERGGRTQECHLEPGVNVRDDGTTAYLIQADREDRPRSVLFGRLEGASEVVFTYRAARPPLASTSGGFEFQLPSIADISTFDTTSLYGMAGFHDRAPAVNPHQLSASVVTSGDLTLGDISLSDGLFTDHPFDSRSSDGVTWTAIENGIDQGLASRAVHGVVVTQVKSQRQQVDQFSAGVVAGVGGGFVILAIEQALVLAGSLYDIRLRQRKVGSNRGLM